MKYERIIDNLYIFKPNTYEDNRGYFFETYKFSTLKEIGIRDVFYQDNQSYSKKGVIRGLHYQIYPFPQVKLVRCIKGEIFDVAVDIRKESPTFGKYYTVILSSENKYMFYIPEGFAHGFQALSEEVEVVYKCTSEYNKDCERGLIWDDKIVNIDWPLLNPIISEKDKLLPGLENIFKE